MFKRVTLTVLALVAVAGARPAEAQFVVVVNAQASVEEVSSKDLSKIFQKKSRRLPDGTDAVPVDLDKSSSVREAFSQAVHGRGVNAIEAFWQQQIFAGKDVPPEALANDAAVLDFVGSTPGAIGYVSEGAALPASVKVVAVS